MAQGSASMVWVDIETTGLDPMFELPLEIGLRVTDAEGNDLDERTLSREFSTLIWNDSWSHDRLYQLDEVVQEMHTASGLIDDMSCSWGMPGDPNRRSPVDASLDIVTWLESLGLEKGTMPMCGSTINFDRGFLERHMPKLHDWFHYRNVDVSTLKNACKLLNPTLAKSIPPKRGVHRVLADIDDSIFEYQFYLDNFLHVKL